MVSSTIVLVPLALAISGQAFRVPTHPIQSRALDALLVGRQITSATDGTEDIPAECKDTCAPALTNFADDTCLADPKCICTNANMKSYGDCMNCILKDIPDSNSEKASTIEQGKSSADALVSACSANGITVTAPVIDSSSSSSGASASGSATGSASGSGAGSTGSATNTASGSGSTPTSGSTGGSTTGGSTTGSDTGNTSGSNTNTTGLNDSGDKDGAALPVRVSGGLLGVVGFIGALAITL